MKIYFAQSNTDRYMQNSGDNRSTRLATNLLKASFPLVNIQGQISSPYCCSEAYPKNRKQQDSNQYHSYYSAPSAVVEAKRITCCDEEKFKVVAERGV